MKNCWWIAIAIFVLAWSVPHSQAYLKSAVFLSPKFVLGPGSVENKFYYGIDFPTGHIAVKQFDAEVIDETGNPVPLHETYLHHWVVARYYVRKGAEILEDNGRRILRESDYMFVKNEGLCQRNILRQYFGLGSETRGTETHIPDPYGLEVGNPTEIPPGYEERWMLNVHAIDTRGVEDKLGCTECRCDLYNVTKDEYDRPLRPDYKGGLACCYDQTQCKLRHGFEGVRRSLYLKYTVQWVDWDSSIVPVKIYIFDVTDSWKRFNDSTGQGTKHLCQIEYDVESCRDTGLADNKCVHTKRTSFTMPTGGYVIYGVAHQHSGGIGAALYREDGQHMCSSIPTYGNGQEAGNEAGYIVGMSTCYPKPGSLRIADGETLIVESNYSSSLYHTGVMGLFYILVTDRVPNSAPFKHYPLEIYKIMNHSAFVIGAIVLLGIIAVAAVLRYRQRNKSEEGYEPVAM